MLNDYERLMKDRVCSILGGDQKAFGYYKNPKDNTSIDILFCKDSPSKNYLTCATLGLVNHKNQFSANGKNIRVELLGLSTTNMGDALGKIMAVTYKNIVEKNLPCAYGAIYEHILEGIIPNSEMKHILFTAPPLFWKENFGTVNLDDNNVLTWLYAMPISNAERKFLKDGQANFKDTMVKLQELFTVKNVDTFDLNRKSII